MRRSVTVILTLLTLCTPGLSAADTAPLPWNQFRGPNGSGVATACHPPVEISDDHLAWKTPLPPGLSSPVLSRDRVFLTAHEGDQLLTLAFDKATGKELWRAAAPCQVTEKVHAAGSPAASTPWVDETRVVVYFGSFGLLCYDHEGEELWRRPIPTPRTLYGMATSPIAYGDTIILVLDNDRNLPGSELSASKIIAVDKETGELTWEQPRPFHRSGWSTPMIWEHDGESDLVVLGNDRLQGYDPATGRSKWRVSGFSRETVAVPIAGDGHLYASSSRRGGDGDAETDPAPYWESLLPFDENGNGKIERREMKTPFTFPFRPELPLGHPGFGMPLPDDPRKRKGRIDDILTWFDHDKDQAWSREEFTTGFTKKTGMPLLAAIRPGGEGDITETHLTWQLNRGIPEVPSPLFHDGLIYLVRAGGVLTAINAKNGAEHYRLRLENAPGQYTASPVAAGGHLYLLSSLGRISVVKTGPEFQLVHQFDLDEAAETTPAIDESSIYFRTERHLFSFRSKKPIGL